MRDRFIRYMIESRERVSRMMIGRNGNDQLNITMLAAALVLLVFGSFFKGAFGGVFRTLAFVLLALTYFRLLSRNVYKRREENDKFLRIRYKAFAFAKGIKERWVQRKDYKFFSCPSCKTVLRVPKGHGKIKIVCRKCGNTFIGKS